MLRRLVGNAGAARAAAQAVRAPAPARAMSSLVVQTPTTQVKTLSNGLRVATEESEGATATVGVFIDAGSAFEDDQNNGTAHFLEHMAFKGTTSRTREQLEEEVENIGASLNAYTSREMTCYYAQTFKDSVPQTVDILSDILQRSTHDEAAIERERGTILREAQEVANDNFETTFDRLHAAAYQGNPLGRTILGSDENISKISRDDLQEYVKRFYRLPRMVVCGAGAIKHEELCEMAEKAFGNLPSEDDPRNADVAAAVVRPEVVGSSIIERDDAVEDLHVAVAVEGVGWSHPDYFTLMLMQTMAGSWDESLGASNNMSSRLCETYATEGLVKSLQSFNTCYKETGLFGAYIVTSEKKAEDAIFEIFNEWNRQGKNPTPSEIERAKTKLKAATLMALDGTTSVVEDMGRQILSLGRRLTAQDVFMRIDAITVADVQRVAQQHCEDVCPVVVAKGPTNKFPVYDVMRGWTYWARM